MATDNAPRIRLPKSWKPSVRSAMLHVVSLAQYAAIYTRSWAADGTNQRVRLKAENDRAQQELIDAVKTKNIALVMSRRSRRTLQSLMRASGAVLETRPGNFLEWVQMYNGVPVFLNDYISDAQTVGTSSDTSTIYCFSMGEVDQGVVGLTAPGGVQLERVGELESKDATRHRVKWYSALGVLSTLSLARLIGVRT